MSLLVGWNIANGNVTPANIICLVLFLLFFIIAIVYFCSFFIYKTILKTAIEALDESEKIVKNSLQLQLKRINFIVNNNPNIKMKKALEIWKIEYKTLVFDKFIEQEKFISEIFTQNKYRKPTLSNLKRIKVSLRELKQISQKIYLMFKEIDKVLMIETIQRNTRIKTREVFNQFKIEANNLIENNIYDFDREKLTDELFKIEKALKIIELNIEKGDFSKSLKYQEVVNNRIIELILLVDLFNGADKFLNKVLLNKINNVRKNLKKRNLSSVELMKLNKKFVLLNNNFEIAKSNTFNYLKNLDYNNAFLELSKIYNVISNFENDLDYENNIRSFIEENMIEFKNFFVTLKEDNKKINSSLEWNSQNNLDLNQVKTMKKDLYRVQQLILNVDEAWIEFLESFEESKNVGDKTSFLGFHNKIMAIFNSLKEIYSILNSISRNLKSYSTIKERIDQEILEIKNILSTTEVQITKNKNIASINVRKQDIDKIFNYLNKIENRDDYKNNNINDENGNEIFMKLQKISKESYTIKNEIKSIVLLNVLVQISIKYLDRYSEYDGFEQLFIPIMNYYKNNEYKKSLLMTIDAIKNFKNLEG